MEKIYLVGWLGFTACHPIGLFYAEYFFIYELTLFTNNFFFFQTQFFYELIFWSIQPIDGTLTGTTTPKQSGPGCNGNEGVLHISQDSRTGTSPHTKDTLILEKSLGK